MKCKTLSLPLFTIVILSIASIANATSTPTTTGKPHSTVQTLTTKNFNQALEDPANGLWLLKFYGKISAVSLLTSIAVVK
jgi:hypothetical protein